MVFRWLQQFAGNLKKNKFIDTLDVTTNSENKKFVCLTNVVSKKVLVGARDHLLMPIKLKKNIIYV